MVRRSSRAIGSCFVKPNRTVEFVCTTWQRIRTSNTISRSKSPTNCGRCPNACKKLTPNANAVAMVRTIGIEFDGSRRRFPHLHHSPTNSSHLTIFPQAHDDQIQPSIDTCVFQFRLDGIASPALKPMTFAIRVFPTRRKISSLFANRSPRATSPWVDAWSRFEQSKYVELSYSPEPHADVQRGPSNNPDVGSSEFSSDAVAAYSHAAQVCTDG